MLKKISSYKITIVEYVVGKRNVLQAIYHVFLSVVLKNSPIRHLILTPKKKRKDKKK